MLADLHRELIDGLKDQSCISLDLLFKFLKSIYVDVCLFSFAGWENQKHGQQNELSGASIHCGHVNIMLFITDIAISSGRDHYDHIQISSIKLWNSSSQNMYM